MYILTAYRNADIQITDINECKEIIVRMTIKEIFDSAENGTLTYAQFEEAVKTSGAKFADLNEGNYVSKQKYTDELASRDTRITELNSTITTRDSDLANLQKTLQDAGDITALKTAASDLDKLQKKYDKETKEYQAKLSKQAYEFAVKEFASGKKFTSKAAQRDFINSMLAKNLTMENGTIMGAEDFVTSYTKDNSDAFVVEETPAPAKPTFVAPTQPTSSQEDPTGGFANAFHFTMIHPNNKQQGGN